MLPLTSYNSLKNSYCVPPRLWTHAQSKCNASCCLREYISFFLFVYFFSLSWYLFVLKSAIISKSCEIFATTHLTFNFNRHKKSPWEDMLNVPFLIQHKKLLPFQLVQNVHMFLSGPDVNFCSNFRYNIYYGTFLTHQVSVIPFHVCLPDWFYSLGTWIRKQESHDAKYVS